MILVNKSKQHAARWASGSTSYKASIATMCLALSLFVLTTTDTTAEESWSTDWRATFDAAASDDAKPILIKYEASWCGPCRELSEEMHSDAIVEKLKPFLLLRIDVDSPPEGAEVDSVTALPTMRVVTSSGREISKKVGFDGTESLITWLDEAAVEYRRAVVDQQAMRQLASGELDDEKLAILLEMFNDQSADRRAAAIGMLANHPDKVARELVQRFRTGGLRERLSILPLLRRWRAPVQSLDPWRPETLSEPAMRSLTEWAESRPDADIKSIPETVDEEVELELDRLVRRGPIRDGLLASLSIVGRDLIPKVMQRWERESSDTARQRLTALRYRLVADPGLEIRIPDAAERLASMESGPRRETAKELSDSATERDLPLLETLFGHPDPLIRELALRGLQNAGGSDHHRLVKLLDDSDKNVRAAVLKLWLDHPDPSLIDSITEHAIRETDAGLLTYYVRLLKANKIWNDPAVAVIEKLSTHADWQVRAEVADAISNHVKTPDHFGRSPSEAMLPESLRNVARQLGHDSDSFVLSKIVPALVTTDQKESFNRLLEVAWKFPEIRGDILPKLRSEVGQKQSASFLKELYESEAAQDRAFAIQAMSQFAMPDQSAYVMRAIHDPSGEVQKAGVRGLSLWLDVYHAQLSVLPKKKSLDDPFGHSGSIVYSDPVSGSQTGVFDIEDSNEGGITGHLFESIGSLFGAGPETPVEIEKEDVVDKNDMEAEDFDFERDTEPPGGIELFDEDLKVTDVEMAEYDSTMAEFGGDADFEDQQDVEATEQAAVKENSEAAAKYDAWLATWRAAPEATVAWLAGAKDAIRPLTQSEDTETQAFAWLTLAKLGEPVELKTLQRILPQLPDAETRVVALYPWLPASQRIEMLTNSGSFHSGGDILAELTDQARIYDLAQSTEAFWSALQTIQPDQVHSGYSLIEKARLVTTGKEYANYSSNRSASPLAEPLAERIAKFDNTIARLVGLILLGEMDAVRAGEMVHEDYADSEKSETLRRDYFRLALSFKPASQGTQMAIDFLGDPALMPVSLAYLAEGQNGVSGTETGSLPVSTSVGMNFNQGKLVVANVSPLIPIESIYPLLESTEPMIAARATYLLAGRGEPVDLAPLKDAVRREGFGVYLSETNKLLIQAIAFRNDDKEVEFIREIYDAMNQSNEYTVKELYWMFRIMTGPRALKLRKQIREDIGIEQLI